MRGKKNGDPVNDNSVSATAILRGDCALLESGVADKHIKRMIDDFLAVRELMDSNIKYLERFLAPGRFKLVPEEDETLRQ